jgi:chloride channel protein, CIC family
MKETVGKFVLCALQLGSGASLGVEGPTVQICAGVSSFLARMARLSPVNQKRMASVGMAAGIAAAFNAPIAAVTFTLEELIGESRPDHAFGRDCGRGAGGRGGAQHSGLESDVSCAAAAELHAAKASSLVWYALLGLLAAIVSVAFTDSLLWLRKWFRSALQRSQVGSAGHRRRGHGKLAVVAICCSFT